ncbi:MAG: THxN family PEP-CTERM protein [Pseudomonadota bacterium]
MRKFSKLIATALCAASLGAFGSASAAIVSFENITGSWSAIDPAAGIAISNNGTANPSLRWGNPATNRGQSGYDFAGAADTMVDVPPNTNVALGTFTHRNNPITGTSLNEATLTVAIDIVVDGQDQGSRNFMFDFSHEETPNGANPCANGEANGSGVNVNGCADLVTVTDSILSEDFLVNGVLYTIAILGFEVGGDIVSTFETIEKMKNRATLVGYITVSEVPIPAAIPLFLSGIAGLGFAGRMKKKQKA